MTQSDLVTIILALITMLGGALPGLLAAAKDAKEEEKKENEEKKKAQAEKEAKDAEIAAAKAAAEQRIREERDSANQQYQAELNRITLTLVQPLERQNEWMGTQLLAMQQRLADVEARLQAKEEDNKRLERQNADLRRRIRQLERGQQTIQKELHDTGPLKEKPVAPAAKPDDFPDLEPLDGPPNE